MPDDPRGAHDADFWSGLAGRRWRRVRWRAGLSETMPTCAAFGTPIHRTGTYYRRPAYTDGTFWLSQQGFDEMMRQTGQNPTRRTRPE